MKNMYKAALLGALGLVSVTAVHAQQGTASINSSYVIGDLLVGIDQTGSANTDVLDIGGFSSLQSGETWNLSTDLGLAGITLNSTADFGVIGLSGTTTMYVTESSTPATIANGPAFTAKNLIKTIGNNEGAQASGSGEDWVSQTEGTTGLAGALGANPNSNVSGDAQLWTVVDNGSNPTEDGFFTLNTSDDVLTYNVTAVPEPSTYGLMAGAGLLIVALRRQFSFKKA